MRAEEIKSLWEKVVENHRVLEACQRHDFSILENDRGLKKTWKCSRCGGVVDQIAKGWYERGIKDATSNSNIEDKPK